MKRVCIDYVAFPPEYNKWGKKKRGEAQRRL